MRSPRRNLRVSHSLLPLSHISFYGGGQRELQILRKAYERLSGHAIAIGKIRTAYEWTEDYVVKYMWSAAGYCLIGFPVLFEVNHFIWV